MNTAVIAGGGIAGIISALLLKREYDQVILIEKQKCVGGLLNSDQNEQGLYFDYGTHFLRDTGVQELDALLYRDVTDENWHVLDYLKAGNYYKGRLNDHSLFPDTRIWPEETYNKGLMELLASHVPAGSNEFDSLNDQLRAIYGNTVTEQFYEPMLKKFYRTQLQELCPDAHMLFGVSRVIAFDPVITEELKKSSLFDGKIAAHHHSEKQSGLRSYYPKGRGIGLWIEQLKKRMDESGITVKTGQSISQIKHEHGNVVSVTLENGESITTDLLVWTIPVFPFLKMTEAMPKRACQPPRRLISKLFHYAFDRDFLTDLYYVCCYDPEIATYRVTLYPNIPSRSESKYYHCTVEVLMEPDDESITSADVRRELDQMGITDSGAKVVYQKEEIVSEGFPVLTNTFVQDSGYLLDTAQNAFDNVAFLGRNAGKTFFMNDVLVNVYQNLTARLKTLQESPV